MRKPIVILGVPIDTVTMDEALNRIDTFVAEGREHGTMHQIATINADFVVNALRDPELRRILQEADLATPDGMPLVWGSRALGVPAASRVTGVDMVLALAERAATRGYSIFFLGGRPGVAQRAVEVLRERWPELKVAGVLAPPHAPLLQQDPAIVAQVRAARPDILLVAFGNPKQEKWISIHADTLRIPVCIGIGGALDMIAGIRRRAPAWVQRMGFEWCYRLLQEPGRLWKRYTNDLVFFSLHFLRQYWAMRAAALPQESRLALEVRAGRDLTTLALSGQADAGNAPLIAERATALLDQEPFLAVDLRQVTALDSAAIGCLLALANQARAAGGCLWLVGVPEPIARLLAGLRLDRFFRCAPGVEAATAARRRWMDGRAVNELYPTGWLVARMPRRLDAANARRVLPCYRELLREHPRLVIDLSETAFLSSAAIAEILRLTEQAESSGAEIRLAGPAKDIAACLRGHGVERHAPLYPSLTNAVTGLRRGRAVTPWTIGQPVARD